MLMYKRCLTGSPGKKKSRDLILCKIWLDMKEERSNIRITNYMSKTKVRE